MKNRLKCSEQHANTPRRMVERVEMFGDTGWIVGESPDVQYVERNKPKKLPKFRLGQKVLFSKSVDNPYFDIDKKECRKLIYLPVGNDVEEGFVVGVKFICEGQYFPGSKGGGYEWDEPETPIFVTEKRHMVYLVKKTLRGHEYKVLPEDLVEE